MKVIVNYDPASGQITDKDGVLIFSWIGLHYEDLPPSMGNKAIEAVAMKLAGVSDNIIEKIT